jgi:hypothetical protein
MTALTGEDFTAVAFSSVGGVAAAVTDPSDFLQHEEEGGGEALLKRKR